MYMFILVTSSYLLLLNIGNTSKFVMWASRFCCGRDKNEHFLNQFVHVIVYHPVVDNPYPANVENMVS
jgi:hypothetical protein